MANITAATIPDDFLRELAAEGWSTQVTHEPYDYLMQPYEVRPPSSYQDDYPNLYNGESGPVA
ncbi:hypothetical protein DVH05_027529 [Phytophthora capsici]|nr:hypothetical protein DVH05_027529 [Phytophthora capsici]